MPNFDLCSLLEVPNTLGLHSSKERFATEKGPSVGEFLKLFLIMQIENTSTTTADEVMLGLRRNELVIASLDGLTTLETYSLTQIKRWHTDSTSIVIDLGEHRPGYLKFSSSQTDAIKSFLTGYLDILSKVPGQPSPSNSVATPTAPSTDFVAPTPATTSLGASIAIEVVNILRIIRQSPFEASTVKELSVGIAKLISATKEFARKLSAQGNLVREIVTLAKEVVVNHQLTVQSVASVRSESSPGHPILTPLLCSYRDLWSLASIRTYEPQ